MKGLDASGSVEMWFRWTPADSRATALESGIPDSPSFGDPPLACVAGCIRRAKVEGRRPLIRRGRSTPGLKAVPEDVSTRPRR